jgi:hypothetical protein
MDKKIHNFIFKVLKNIYNTRIYKMKIFFYILGVVILTKISINFIEEKDSNIIKQTLKNISICNDEDFENFGIKQSFIELSYIFGVVGAFWGASFTVEKNIGKWWGSSSKRIFAIKVLSIFLVNSFFIFSKYYSPYLFNTYQYELNFILKSLLNFLQYFFLFGIIPIILEKIKLIEKKRRKSSGNSKNIIRDEDDDDIILFRTSIFKDEKKDEDNEGFVVLDKEVVKKGSLNEIEEKRKKEKDKNNNGDNENEALNKSDEEIIIIDKKDGKTEEIYGPSPLVENVHNLEDEEEYQLVYEGMNDGDENIPDK